MRKKLLPWAHGDHGGHGSGPNDHGSVTARRGHSSVTAQSRLCHSKVTAQSRHLQYDHGSVMARSQLSHGWLWPFWSPWAHCKQSRWPIFFSWACMFRSASLFIGTSFTVAVFTIFATSNVDSIVGIPLKMYSMQRILIHIKSQSLC